MNRSENLAKKLLCRFYGRLLLAWPLVVGVAIAA
jgi:hypothetical protein